MRPPAVHRHASASHVPPLRALPTSAGAAPAFYHRPILHKAAGFVADAGALLLLVRSGFAVPYATGLACLLGSVVRAGLQRFLGPRPRSSAAWRDLGIDVVSAVLNAWMVAMVLGMAAWDYRLAWLLVRIGITFGWHSPLQRFLTDVDRRKRSSVAPPQDVLDQKARPR